ncbi:TMEM175 family protein [Synechococcus sp. BA-132 BA5]|uniref:TMEM175 family protein n=1 Tax=Synechococcus sp. BA-132 BA5 TaxID=3110252 RepID=UPI002B20CFF2|nr:TMEM175 family protein [Synechococcus sp. BA-132 BA5]MEA5414215.1 TMEM175 family protein [Synechococcus sp. BA-132 BA5]
MNTTRLEAFSDGVLAIVITIMVLEIKVPHDTEPAALVPLIPVFLSYLLSFVYIGIYWNNHHHMLHTLQRVSGSVLLANLHLLFWLSLVPFATGWMGQNHRAIAPAALYGAVMVMAAVAYFLLQGRIIASQGPDSLLRRAVGRDWKGHTSLTLYLVAMLASLRSPALAQVIYALVALMWLIPDRRIERVLSD